MTEITGIESLKQFFELDADDDLDALDKEVYDRTECGAQIVFISSTGEKLPVGTLGSFPDGFDIKIPEDMLVGEITGFCFISIVEGSDAEFASDYIAFPATEEAIKAALQYIDDIVDEFCCERDNYLAKVRIWTEEHGGLYKLESTGNGFEWIDPEINFTESFPDRLKTEIPAVLNDIDDMEIPFFNEETGNILSYIQNKAKEFTTKSGSRFKAWIYYHTDDEIDPRAATR